MRLVEIVAVAAAAAAVTACEKAEDRAAAGSAPRFDARYCFTGGQRPGLHMPPGGCILSDNHAYVLDLTPSGVLEIRAMRSGRPAEPVWTSRVQAKKPDGSEAVFQGDGNLVVYEEGGAALWNSGPLAAGDYRLFLTDNGNLMIRTTDGRPMWMARLDLGACAHFLEAPAQLAGGCLISPSGAYAMALTAAAGLEVAPVLEGKTLGKPIWTSGSAGSGPPGSFLAMQTDGNLVLYDGPKAIWVSQTSGHPGTSRLALTDQGELQLRGPDGGLLWSSKTGRAAAS